MVCGYFSPRSGEFFLGVFFFIELIFLFDLTGNMDTSPLGEALPNETLDLSFGTMWLCGFKPYAPTINHDGLGVGLLYFTHI